MSRPIIWSSLPDSGLALTYEDGTTPDPATLRRERRRRRIAATSSMDSRDHAIAREAVAEIKRLNKTRPRSYINRDT